MRQYEELSDEELITRAKNGDSEVLDYLMEKYKGLVKNKARTMYLIGGENDDLIQEGMIGLFKAVRDFQPGRDASFQTFARVCVERQMYNAIKNSNRQKHQPLNSYISLSGEKEGNEDPLKDMWVENPESIIIDRENVRNLEEEISSALSPMENQVLKLYLNGSGYTEIARILKKSPKSVDNALSRIRGKIREKMMKYEKNKNMN
ncbi:MAG: RNA polymerase sporulation sigma factor SigH [Clostridia bacterium]|nr:RNA polymerase sporulation sigma factor SigH [Clostridia bacterium]MDY5555885.1 RNA polymerase sporulation sigma factor SigH [Blautia sp.]